MTESAGAVQNGLVLRLSAPLAGEMAAVGPEMAAKLAEQLGLDQAGAARVKDTMSDLAGQMDQAAGADVAYEFHKFESELRIEARQGSRVAERRVSLRS